MHIPVKMSVLTLEAKLERVDPSTPWGFRMQGGKDFHSPLSIQRVSSRVESVHIWVLD